MRVTVQDVAGRRVATLANRFYEAGKFGLAWDGMGEDGERLGSGLYFLVVDGDGARARRKVMLLR